jgi:PhoH-like ATPase
MPTDAPVMVQIETKRSLASETPEASSVKRPSKPRKSEASPLTPKTPEAALATSKIAHAGMPQAEPLPALAAPANRVNKSAKGRTKRRNGPSKLFVLDTNVLMHDPMSLFRFEEHDVFLPMIVLEELDSNKKGMTEVARNARQASRSLDALASGQGQDLSQGSPLSVTGHSDATGQLFFQTQTLDLSLPLALPQGSMALPPDFWLKNGKTVESWQQGTHTFYRISGPIVPSLFMNQFVYFEAPGEPSLYARVTEIRGKTAVLRTLKDFNHQKNAIWGVTTRNREQNFAMNLLTDPDIDFVTLAGTAGTGKTLMALAAGLTQVLDDRRYTEIIMTRATVSVGEDIGFLPGTEEEKMGPWMGALDDNLEFLAKGEGGNAGEWGRAATNELIKSRIKIKSMNFMRGRTFMNKYVIIDEAQNLTPKQMKTLITRAGPGTKIICMGNLAQIDTPYLTEGSSGLTYAVDRFKGWAHGGHITLARGERSRLADFASEAL